MSTHPLIFVAGTGPVGLVAALALARSGFSVTLAGPRAEQPDRRTTAIMAPGLRLLDTLGVGDALREGGAPLRVMRIIDGTKRLLRSAPVTFRAAEIGEDAFGWNVPNKLLLSVLEDAANAEPSIARIADAVTAWMIGEQTATATMAGGQTVEAPLVVAADGRGSLAREAAGITVRARTLPQSALVLSFAHSREHGFISNEFHTESGPFTQVPLPGRHSSLVWVEAPERAEELMAASDAEISRLIEERMHGMLGRVTADGERQLFPLSSLHPSLYAANRVALVGEAAHTIPPIGAQGLNLGLGDVSDLLRAAQQHRSDLGGAAMLSAYHAARAFSVGTRSTAVNLLNASLLAAFPGAQLLRSAGLAMLGRIAPLRAFFMREGMEPGSGLRGLL